MALTEKELTDLAADDAATIAWLDAEAVWLLEQEQVELELLRAEVEEELEWVDPECPLLPGQRAW